MRTGVPLLLAMLLASPLVAQAPTASEVPGDDEQLVDWIVAVVGDSAIFYSDLQEQLLRMEAQGFQAPTGEEERLAYEREALNSIVVESLVLQAADRDTLITVPEDRLEQDFRMAWEQEVRSFGTEADLRRAVEAAGMTLEQHQANRRDELRNALLIQQYVALERQRVRVPPVEESEIREFFEQEQAFLGSRPATLTFRQVVLVPTASEEARQVAREEAQRIRDMLDDGADFADLARRFSDDPGSGQRGGELGWIRRGTMVPEFETATFALSRGQTSDIVETSYGSHIIHLERIRGAERLVRHILIAPEVTEADIQRARQRATEIQEAVASGTSIATFADEGEATGLPDQLELAMDQLEQLPAGYAFSLRTAQAGDVVGPIEFIAQGQTAFAVAHVTNVREAGQFQYEDVRDQIRERIREERFEERIIDRLMAETHVDTRW
jgi:peptidyl-prolyl cis-trans isomerase SurA